MHSLGSALGGSGRGAGPRVGGAGRGQQGPGEEGLRHPQKQPYSRGTRPPTGVMFPGVSPKGPFWTPVLRGQQDGLHVCPSGLEADCSVASAPRPAPP